MNITKFTEAPSKDVISTLGFTDDQRKAYEDIISFIDAPYNEEDSKRAISGAAGTGKTYLVKALIKNCNVNYSQIGLAAPTHKACRVLGESIGISNVKVNTLQSDLGLRVNFDVENFNIDNPPFDPRGRIKIGDYKVYIIDEASMINFGLCKFVEKLCKNNKCKLIYIGDPSQLPPVGEKYSSAFKNIKINSLKKIVRQEDDNPIRYLLDLLRYDIAHKSFTFLNYIAKNREGFDDFNTKGYKVCNKEEFDNAVSINFSNEELTHNVDFCKVIAYTNMKVSYWNKFIRNSIIKDAEKSIITKNDLIISYSTIVNEFNDIVIANSEEYILQDVVNYTHPTYDLKGFLVRFIAIHGGKITQPLFVIDHKDNFTISKYYQISTMLVNKAKNSPVKLRASAWSEYYKFKEGCLLLTNIANPTTEKILYKRDIDYGFSLTAHKSQGSTFDTALVDINDIVYDKYGKPYTDAEAINRRLYVACSRCKNKLYMQYGY